MIRMVRWGEKKRLSRRARQGVQQQSALIALILVSALPTLQATLSPGSEVASGKSNPSTGCSGTLCGSFSSEPLTREILALRESTSCTLDNSQVEAIAPGSPSNPLNVKTVERVLPESKFKEFFPKRNSAYTYSNFLRAIGKYPAICKNASNCGKILAGMFAHFQQETAGLFYLEEIDKSSAYCAQWTDWVTAAYPCAPGQKYYGRGAKQLSWNYNYGAFSKAMYGDASVLLEQPDLVASTWLNFASSIWFYVTPQPPKPSMLQVVEGTWRPNSADTASRLEPGFGTTTMIINGALECGQSPSNANGATNRANYYKDFASRLGVNIAGEKLTCSDSQPFSTAGSAGALSLYWAPETGCSLVKWQTAYSALVEGDYNACKGIPCSEDGSGEEGEVGPGPETTTASGNICLDLWGFYPHESDCQQYYQCANGKPHQNTCRDGLLWNQALNVCDWAANVQCSAGKHFEGVEVGGGESGGQGLLTNGIPHAICLFGQLALSKLKFLIND